MRYVIARLNQHQRDWAYRIYVTDGLYVLSRGGLTMRYTDIFAPQETRKAEDIIDGIRGKLRRLR